MITSEKLQNISSELDKLKDKNIMIIGGTSAKLRDRLRSIANIEMVPISEVGRTPRVRNNTDLVGVLYKSMCHPDRWNLQNQLKTKKIPMVYIGSSNVENIIKTLASCV